ncbi:MAG: hypothetical protein R3362_07765, partial [Rhodothermales bacterium]|nr:hypothetical protein [Rhodothermales bacterium]
MTLAARCRLLVALALLGLCGAGAARAQEPLAWERLSSRWTYDVFFDADTLYVADDDGLRRLAPIPEDATDATWSENLYFFEFPLQRTAVTAEGYLLADSGSRLDRYRPEDGEWHRQMTGGWIIEDTWGDLDRLARPPHAGRILTGVNAGAAFSDDGGDTWTYGTGLPARVEAFAEVPAGPHAGRVLAAAWDGLLYSDDGGQTWAENDLTDVGGYSTIAYAVAAGPGGRAYANVSSSAYGSDGVVV